MANRNKKNNINKLSMFAFWILVISVIVFPYIVTIPFSTPFSDDYWMAATISNLDGNVVFNAVEATNSFYINWAGGWPFNFIQILFNPLLYFPSSSFVYGAELSLFFLLFVVIFYFYWKCVFRYIFKFYSLNKIRLYFTLFLFVFLNTGIYSEIFYWFVGNSYLWECFFCLLNQICIIIFFRKKSNNIKYFVFLLVIGFIACFAYQLAVISGFLYIFELYNYIWCNKRKNRIMIWIPLLVMILAGIVSCFAPGNFYRQQATAINSGVSFTSSAILYNASRAIYYAAQNSFISIINMLKQPLFVLLLGVSFLIGRHISSNLKIFGTMIVMFVSFLIIFLVCFPIAYGYSSSDLPNRCIFVINFAIILVLCFSFILIGHLFFNLNIKSVDVSQLSKLLILCMCVYTLTVFVYYAPSGVRYYKQIPWATTVLKINDCYHESCFTKETLKFLEEDVDANVAIDGNKYSIDEIEEHASSIGPRTGIIRKFVLSSGKDHWVNIAVAKYYNKESVVVKYT